MKTDIFKVTLHLEGIYFAHYRFIGRAPTKEELLAAIKRRLNGSLVSEDIGQALYERRMVSEIGIPVQIGPCTGDTWEIMGIELGRVQVEREEAWTLCEES
jgi:hypothetical protein